MVFFRKKPVVASFNETLYHESRSTILVWWSVSSLFGDLRRQLRTPLTCHLQLVTKVHEDLIFTPDLSGCLHRCLGSVNDTGKGNYQNRSQTDQNEKQIKDTNTLLPRRTNKQTNTQTTHIFFFVKLNHLITVKSKSLKQNLFDRTTLSSFSGGNRVQFLLENDSQKIVTDYWVIKNTFLVGWR